MDLDLYEWQEAALERWRQVGRRGIVEATTGSGKTRLALAAIADVWADHPDACVAVVVPKIVLATQWRHALQMDLGLMRSAIASEHSDLGAKPYSGERIAVFVIDSARSRLATVVGRWRERHPGTPILILVDECHGSGSHANARIYDTHFEFAMGISATPERTDQRHLTHIQPALGPVIFRYTLEDALRDAVVADIRAVNLYVRFDQSERRRWREMDSEIERLARVLVKTSGDASRLKLEARAQHDQTARRLLTLLRQQETLIDTCADRQRCADALVDWIERSAERILIFNERIEAAIQVHHELQQRGVHAEIEHSKLPPERRADAIDRFKSGRARVLVAVRSLDEGVDIPDASVGVALAGGRTKRQRIQRIGRVARRSKGKQSAIFVSILALDSPEATFVGLRDEHLFGAERVTHHAWPDTSISDALESSASTLSSAAIAAVAPDPVLAQFLGLDTEVIGTGRNEAARQHLAAARKAVRDRVWRAYATETEAASALLIDACGREQPPAERNGARWLGDILDLTSYPLIERQAMKALEDASRLASTDRETDWARAISRIHDAHGHLDRASFLEEQLRDDLEEHEVRQVLGRIVDDVERAVVQADRPSIHLVAKRIKKWDRARRKGYWLRDRSEFDALRRRLETAVGVTLAAATTSAEELEGRTDAASCAALCSIRDATQVIRRHVRGKAASASKARLRQAVRGTLLALTEELEELTERTDCLSGAEHSTIDDIESRWQACGGSFDDDMAHTLGARFQRTLLVAREQLAERTGDAVTSA